MHLTPALAQIVEESASVIVPAPPLVLPFTAFLVVGELPAVGAAISVGLFSKPMPDAVIEVAIVFGSVSPEVDASTLRFPVRPLPVV